MRALIIALLLVPALAAQPPGGTTASSTAFSTNGTVAVSYENGSTTNMSAAIAGIETTNATASGNIVSSSAAVTINVGGCTYTGTLTGRVSQHGRYYSVSFQCNGRTIKVSFFLGHASGEEAFTVTVSHPATNPHGFGYGTHTWTRKTGIEGVLPVN